jgi:Na/Pi-cotransporter
MVLALSVALLFAGGCGGTKENIVKKVKILHGNNQCVTPLKECGKSLKIELLGPKHKGMFGGKGSQYPVVGVKVRFEPLNNSDVKVVCENNVTDHGGTVVAKIIAGKKVGDQYIKIIPEGFESASTTVRVISGISLKGANQEAFAGENLEDPIALTVYNSDGKPVPNVPVYFWLSSSPEKKIHAKLSKSKVLTDKNGTALNTFKIGSKTGTYKIVAEVDSPDMKVRSIVINQMGMDLWGLKGIIITVLGGLAIFIYGMKQMTDGLQLVAGDKMKSILNFFTRNRVAAVIAGTLVTGVIQSSSACTVMVVGFVNAGLLSLQQALGVVFGANIGTTVTAQLISFKLGLIAFPCIALGVILMMVSKRFIVRGWASVMMGFGMLFFGLGIMSGALKIIAKFPSIVGFFSQFDCSPLNGGSMPLGAVLGALAIGTLMTVLIQSSSATIGIALALASSGLINFYTAVPLILGDNIGTTVTANLAALGGNRRAKQTAFAHFIFNAFGATYMIILFYFNWNGYPFFMEFINKITPGNVFEGENVVRHIAMAHSMFNIFNVLLFLPFIALIAKFCNFIIPIPEGEKETINYLEPHLLDTPSVAIEQTIQSLRYMVKESWKMVTCSMEESFLKGEVDNELKRKLEEREERIDQLQKDITKYLVQLTERPLTEPQAAIIPYLMHCTNDAERIADHTENIISLTIRVTESKNKLSGDAIQDLENLWETLKQQAEHVIAGLDSTSKTEVNLAKKVDVEVDKLADKLESNHVDRLNSKACKVDAGIIFIEMVAELEKIGDHFANIAERTSKIQKHHVELNQKS